MFGFGKKSSQAEKPAKPAKKKEPAFGDGAKKWQKWAETQDELHIDPRKVRK